MRAAATASCSYAAPCSQRRQGRAGVLARKPACVPAANAWEAQERRARGGCLAARARRGAAKDSGSSSNGNAAPASTTALEQSGSVSPRAALGANTSLVSQLVFSVSIIACSLSVAIAALLFTFIPAIKSFKRAADEIALLARLLREETPDTLATLRLSGVEVADCVEEIGELSNDLTRGLRQSARTIAATSGAVKGGAHYVKDNVYPVVKERVVPVAANTMKTVLDKRAGMKNYDKPIVAMAASRTGKIIKGLRGILLARDVYRSVGGGSGGGGEGGEGGGAKPAPIQPATPQQEGEGEAQEEFPSK